MLQRLADAEYDYLQTQVDITEGGGAIIGLSPLQQLSLETTLAMGEKQQHTLLTTDLDCGIICKDSLCLPLVQDNKPVAEGLR